MPKKTVFGHKIAPGDLVTDESGDYEKYGKINRVTRKGMEYIATTESGVELSFLPTDRVQVERE